MVLGALDYFVAGQEIPPTTTAPMGEGDPLFLHLVNRIFNTFSVDSVSLLLKGTSKNSSFWQPVRVCCVSG